MAVIAGLDGCKGGWLCLTQDLSTSIIEGRILRQIEEVLLLKPRPQVLAVDVPIGLTDHGSRECDLEARVRLKAPRASSVFSAPVRPVLSGMSYEEASNIGRRTDGRGISQQLWGILPKIREVDTFLRSDLSLTEWIREVHPEVCFWYWNGGRAMLHAKKKAQGREERERLVISCYGPAYRQVQLSLPRGHFANDDLLDAFAALWSAKRVTTGHAVVLPTVPPIDSCGLRMEMVA